MTRGEEPQTEEAGGDQDEKPQPVRRAVRRGRDGRLAYLPLYSDVGINGTGIDGDRMLVLDLAKAQVVRTVSFGRGVRPHDPVLDPKTGLLYVTTELDHAVAVVDSRNNAILGSIPTGANQTHMLVLSHDGRFGYTANVSSGTVSVLDLRARTLVQTIPVAPVIQRISISPDDRTVVTSDQEKPRLALIDTQTRRVRDWVPLPSLSYGTAFSRDGRMLLATLLQAGQLVAIDPVSKQILHTVAVGTRPQAVLIRPDGAVAYVSCLGGGDVAVVDLRTWQVTGRIATGPKADGMAWIP